MSLRAELDISKLCYADFAPELWDLLMAILPENVLSNVDNLSLAVQMLRAALALSKTPCQAIRNALEHVETSPSVINNGEALCLAHLTGTKNAIMMRTSPLLTCLSAAYNTGRATLLRTSAEEAADTAKMQAMKTNDESMTFEGTYASVFTQTVVDSVKTLTEERLNKK